MPITEEEEKRVKEAFMAAWFDGYGTYAGWRQAYDWWVDPRQECLIENRARRNDRRCIVKCQTCTSRLVNQTNV